MRPSHSSLSPSLLSHTARWATFFFLALCSCVLSVVNILTIHLYILLGFLTCTLSDAHTEVFSIDLVELLHALLSQRVTEIIIIFNCIRTEHRRWSMTELWHMTTEERIFCWYILILTQAHYVPMQPRERWRKKRVRRQVVHFECTRQLWVHIRRLLYANIWPFNTFTEVKNEWFGFSREISVCACWCIFRLVALRIQLKDRPLSLLIFKLWKKFLGKSYIRIIWTRDGKHTAKNETFWISTKTESTSVFTWPDDLSACALFIYFTYSTATN